jgi:hypothetical protein
MRRITTLTLLAACLFVAREAAAQALEGNTTATISGATKGTGLGLGVAAMLDGPAGLSAAFDGGPWHLDSMLGFSKGGSGSPVTLGIGVRFWYHLAKSSDADFSVGGGLGFTHVGANDPDDRDFMTVEGGGLVRAFIASNVALSVSAGLAITALDRSNVSLGGMFIGGAAIHYYFF